ncbi:cytochrome P450 [Enterococcus ratti]|uniref:Cytochrome P450 n=1 Tax=Enterococcus ratti TaxID=150033 RepID=A0A1L8WHM5_9ENTE|nr:cytochrome P450 [Enterococcus ratti]OJG80529.1 cytochrome P450 [Enterococcus ratti]
MKEVPVVNVKMTELKELYQQGYHMLQFLRNKADAPVVKAKLFNKEAIVVYGSDAAKIFYDPRNFTRKKAMPKLVLKTLFGKNGVQTLDGAQHHHRKAVFMDLMTPEKMKEYRLILDRNFTHVLDEQHGQFEWFDLSKRVLFSSICEWAGINLSELSKEEINQLADYQISMISGAVTSPKDHIKGLENRKKSEKWAQKLIKSARENPIPEKKHVALYAFAQATELNGQLLPVEVAAVELLNIIRPTVALTIWAALMGHALFSRPDLKQQLKNNFSELQDPFIQELRRYYPFFPMIPGIALKDVVVDNYFIPKDSWVLLDVYGTNHDERTIEAPESFMIKRYIGKAKDLSYEQQYEMIAQGGGDFRQMHRCAGEWITLHSLRVFSDQLVNRYEFSVPEQDWRISVNQFPTYPNSRVLLYKN